MTQKDMYDELLNRYTKVVQEKAIAEANWHTFENLYHNALRAAQTKAEKNDQES